MDSMVFTMHSGNLRDDSLVLTALMLVRSTAQLWLRHEQSYNESRVKYRETPLNM
jgi:hypothetical protein